MVNFQTFTYKVVKTICYTVTYLGVQPLELYFELFEQSSKSVLLIATSYFSRLYSIVYTV